MRILHTADVHIREYQDERWTAFQEIINLAKSEEVDALVISGDLFESSADAHKLRPKTRELFTSIEFPVMLIAGNHDAEAYPEGAFLGEKVTVIHDFMKPVAIKGVFFWGFPYEDMLEDEILEYLNFAAGRAQEGTTHILIFHAELLDITGGWGDYGEEGRRRYLPVKLSYFQNLPWQYILAGHFHNTFDVHEFKAGAYYVYPGSPVSVTRRETGPRKVNLFEVGKAPEPRTLKSFYYEKMEIRLDPLQQENPIRLINQKLQDLPENVRLLLDISGYFNGKQLNMTEEELQRAINKLAGKGIEVSAMEFRDISDILEDDLFHLFLERLEMRTIDLLEKKRIIDMTLQAMMESQA